MNIFSAIIESIIQFVKENPLTTLFIVMLVAFAPSLMGGLLIGLLILVGLLLLIPIIALFRLHRISRRMEREARSQQQQYTRTDFTNHHQSREGEVNVYTTSDRPQKRVNDDVGDYVDFEEVKKDK